MLRVRFGLKQRTIYRVRKTCASVVHQEQIVTVHQRPKQSDIAMPGFGCRISRTTFHCDNRLELLGSGVLMRIELKPNLNSSRRCARRVKRTNNRAAVSRHALASSKPQRLTAMLKSRRANGLPPRPPMAVFMSRWAKPIGPANLSWPPPTAASTSLCPLQPHVSARHPGCSPARPALRTFPRPSRDPYSRL